MLFPPIFIDKASLRNLCPSQTSHVPPAKKLFLPSPEHSGHAPWGELKEKSRGSISGNEKLSFGQVQLEDSRNSFLGYEAITNPLLYSSAFSTASESLEASFNITLSTTISISCISVSVPTVERGL